MRSRGGKFEVSSLIGTVYTIMDTSNKVEGIRRTQQVGLAKDRRVVVVDADVSSHVLPQFALNADCNFAIGAWKSQIVQQQRGSTSRRS